MFEESIATGTSAAFQMRTTIKQAGKESVYLYEGMGRIIAIGNWFYLRYSEKEGAVPVTFKFSRDGSAVTIIRGDQDQTRVNLRANRSAKAEVNTAQGILQLKTLTDKLLLRLSERPFAGTIDANYRLVTDEQILGHYRMELHFTT